MGLTDLFKRDRSSIVLGPRQFSLRIAGHGVEAMPHWPIAIAHLADGTLVLGPIDIAAAKAAGNSTNVLIRPGTPPTGALEKRRNSEHGIVTYSSAERGTTQLVLGVGMQSYDQLLARFHTTADTGPWRIVTDNCELAWPASLLLKVDGDLASPSGPFVLALDGSAGKLITFHGPYLGDGIPTREQLIPPSQHHGEAGKIDGANGTISWCSSTVQHEATTWIQRYYTVPLDVGAAYIIRAQTTLDQAPALFAAADVIARSLRPRF